MPKLLKEVMLKEEFEKLTGRKVSPEEYAKANAVYEQTYLSKEDFCAMYDGCVKGNPFVEELSTSLSNARTRINSFRKVRDELAKLIVEHEFTLPWGEVSQKAVNLVGLDLWIRCKLELDAPLAAKEREYLISKL